VAYREAAAKCRQEALSSADPEQWMRLAETWEWLADAIDRMYQLSRELAKFDKIQKEYGMTNRASEASGRRPPPILCGRVAIFAEFTDGAARVEEEEEEAHALPSRKAIDGSHR
jgi:hypothetical protein